MRTFLYTCLFFQLPTSLSAQLMGDHRSQFEYAQERFKSGNFSYAIDYCSGIINNADINKYNKVEVYKLRAMAYRAIGDYTKAAFDYREAIEWGKRDAYMYLNMAQVYMCQKNFSGAEQALNEAIRLSGSRKNYYLLEDYGRLSHYMGRYKEAVDHLREAIDNGSTMAYIDLLSALFRSKEFSLLRQFSDTLLHGSRQSGDGLLSDSSLYYYVRAVNGIAKGGGDENIYNDIERALLYYRNIDPRCFKGYFTDILAAKAFVASSMNNDTMAYELYNKMFAINNMQADVKLQIDDLRIKLKIDATPPQIVIKNPIIGDNNVVTVNNLPRYEMYGVVTDSSAISSVLVNNIPVSRVEEDGIFVFSLDLQPGKNDVEVVAVDKYDNKAVKTFLVNNVSSEEAVPDDLNTIGQLTATATYHAILIGMNDYDDNPAFKDLVKPAEQVNELKKILVSEYEFDEKNVMMLLNPTKADLLDSLQAKTALLTDNDNLLIYYAGHGKVRMIAGSVEGAYLIPKDGRKDKWFSYVSSHEIKATLRETEARHVLFIADACYAGAMLTRASFEGAPPGIIQSYRHSSRKMLTSGNLEEVPDNGKFFENLKSYLLQNRQRYSTAQDLATYVMTNKDASNPQYERIPDMPKEFGGQFVFIRKQ